MKIEHIALNVGNTKEMVQWYETHLNMKTVRANNDTNNTTFIADSAGSTLIEFYNNPESQTLNYEQLHPLMLHIAFSVDDMDATRQRLINAGATAVGEVNNLPNGDQLAMLRDPWGLCIQLAKRSKPLA